MKQFKILTILFVALVTFNCSSDDDSSSDNDGPAPEPTTQELLAGKWYLTSGTEVEIDDCILMTYLEFINQVTLITESFSKTSSGACQSSGPAVLTYTLIDNEKTLKAVLGETELILSIEFISETKLILKDRNTILGLERKK